MEGFWYNLLNLLARYVHVVGATLLVGGTLFYEMVVPIAIDELKTEQQLLVFGRARWVFRWIVWMSLLMLLFSGILSASHNWPVYDAEATGILKITYGAGTTQPHSRYASVGMRPGWWFAAHLSTGVVAVVIALFLTIGRRPPEQPVRWMRMNLVVLLIVMFLASATRHVRLLVSEKAMENGLRQVHAD